jgi:hypothetical protein
VCVIYRREEMHKVIVHELMHIWGIDCGSSVPKDSVIQTFFNIVCDMNGLRLGEAYNDALACLYLITLRIYFKRGIDDFYRVWTHELKRGQKWTASVAGNVIRFYKNKSWHEKTHVFSYYVGKAIIFMHLEQFDDWLNKTYAFNDSCPDFYEFMDPFLTNTNVEKLGHSQDISCAHSSLRMFCKPT